MKYEIDDSGDESGVAVSDMNGYFNILNNAVILGPGKKRVIKEYGEAREHFIEKGFKDTEIYGLCQKGYFSNRDYFHAKKYLENFDLLFAGHIKYVAKIAGRFTDNKDELEDLSQEGMLGLKRAIESFDYKKGYQLISYAHNWIMKFILRALSSNNFRNIRVPVYANNENKKIESARVDIYQSRGKFPNISEIAEHLGNDMEYVEKFGFLPVELPLDEPLNDRQTGTFSELMPDDETPLPDCIVLKKLFQEEVREKLDELMPLDRYIMEARSGIGHKRAKTLEEIAMTLGKSKQSIEQREKRILRKLKNTVSWFELYMSCK